ncbi:spermidine/putrescine transport system substrate-binding protein [Loktanella fryxellensis]|uniref:Spermidine/putrescine transport system substrate-binding protein n=1 Tax=Loktanella fryxellensis TaxID=245187 RepID=A0A1H8I203_9RHOB|nr:ABC transporter substrate-binding protein [Loktanella fryxellensis]SEN62237.1 spermidine/putrescine transport system substrate-binding protein [Loktanella fryxellensis]
MTTKTLIAGTALALLAGTALATTAMAQDGELLILDYPGFEVPDYHTAYIEAHGAAPTFSFFGDEDEAFQKIRSGFQADIAHICAGSVTKWAESGILEEWDTTRITAYGDLDSNLTGTDVAATDGVFFIPTDFGSTGIAYNPDEVPAEDVASLQVFKDPKYQGRVSLPDNVDDAFALAYLATGVADWTEATDAQFEAAATWLREVHPNLRTYWTDPAELAQLMASGEILVSWAWNETYPTMVAEGRPIGFQRNTTEGSSLWLCGYVNLADGQGSEDKAYDYINAMLAPSSAMPLLENGFGTSNQAALTSEITQEQLVAAGLEPIDVPVLAQLPMSNAARERQAETFELIKAGF